MDLAYDFDTVLDIDINESFDDDNATELILHCLLLLLFLLLLLLSLEGVVPVECPCDGCVATFDGDPFLYIIRCIHDVRYAAVCCYLKDEGCLSKKTAV